MNLGGRWHEDWCTPVTGNDDMDCILRDAFDPCLTTKNIITRTSVTEAVNIGSSLYY